MKCFWTWKEDFFLIKNCSKMSTIKMSKCLKRSASSVKNRRFKLKTKYKNQFENWFNDNAPNLNKEDALYTLECAGMREATQFYERWRKEYMKVRNII